MIFKISLRAKGGVPKTLLEQNTLMLTESREEFSDLHSILDFVRFAIAFDRSS